MVYGKEGEEPFDPTLVEDICVYCCQSTQYQFGIHVARNMTSVTLGMIKFFTMALIRRKTGSLGKST